MNKNKNKVIMLVIFGYSLLIIPFNGISINQVSAETNSNNSENINILKDSQRKISQNTKIVKKIKNKKKDNKSNKKELLDLENEVENTITIKIEQRYLLSQYKKELEEKRKEYKILLKQYNKDISNNSLLDIIIEEGMNISNIEKEIEKLKLKKKN